MDETKEFSLRTILSVTTGRLLTKGNSPNDNGIGDLYDLLGWMTNDQPFTHQLPRFATECKPWLLRWFPGLPEEVEVAEFCDQLKDLSADKLTAAIEGFVWGLGERYGRHALPVPRIPQDDHERKNPLDELVAMRGTDEGIEIVVADND